MDETAPVPVENLDDETLGMHYAGADDWVVINAGSWGWVHADLSVGVGHMVVSRALADRPELLCRRLVHTVLLNFLSENRMEGWGCCTRRACCGRIERCS